MNWTIRKYRDSDKAFVSDAWVRSCRKEYHVAEMKGEVIRKFGERVCALLTVSDTLLAVDPVNEDIIYGFICFEKGLFLGQETPTLHYIYVRKDFRKFGIESNLFYHAFADTTALTQKQSTGNIYHVLLIQPAGHKMVTSYTLDNSSQGILRMNEVPVGIYVESEGGDAYVIPYSNIRHFQYV